MKQKIYKITEEQLKDFIALKQQRFETWKGALSVPSLVKKRLLDEIHELRSMLKK